MSDEAPVYEESITSAAIDGARIACVTAQTLVQLDNRLPGELKEELVNDIMLAREALDVARAALVTPVTSLHRVVQEESRIIIPGGILPP